MTTTSTLLIPPGWRQTTNLDTGLQRFEPGRLPPSGFMPRVTLVCSAGATPLADFLQEQAAQLSSALPDVVIEEIEIHDLGDRDVGYVRALHQNGEHHLVTELWSWVDCDDAWVLSASVALSDYLDFDALFETMAWSFDPC